jgi:sarcosine oxidase subunit beta
MTAGNAVATIESDCGNVPRQPISRRAEPNPVRSKSGGKVDLRDGSEMRADLAHEHSGQPNSYGRHIRRTLQVEHGAASPLVSWIQSPTHVLNTNDLPAMADAIILGGGVTGSSIAYHLTQFGLRNVILLERGPLASGVTGRSGAQLIPRSEHPVVARLKWEGIRFYREFERRHGRRIGFCPSGYLGVAPIEEEHTLHADERLMCSLGSGARRVNAAEVREICPSVQMSDHEAALHIPEAAFTDPVAVVQSLISVAEEAGAKPFPYTPAAIRIKGDSVVSVVTTHREIETRTVVVAAGVWTNELLNPIGTGLPISWHRAEVSYYRRPDDVADHPIIGDFTQRFYFRPELGGFTMAGSIPYMSADVTSPKGLEPVLHPDGMRDGVSLETMRSLLEKLTGRIPRFAAGYWRRGHACVYDVSPDWHPILSFEDRIRGLYAAAGFSGHGFVMSPAVGRIVAQRVVGAVSDPVEYHAFRPERFAEGQPVTFSIG